MNQVQITKGNLHTQHRSQRKVDNGTFEKIVEKWRSPLFLYIQTQFYLDVERAQDVLQNVWYKIISKPEKLSKVRNLNAYLYRIAHNEALNSLNGEKRYCQIKPAIEFDLQNKADYRWMWHLYEIELRNAIRKLPAKYSEVIQLHYLEEKDVKEISEIIGVKVGTVLSRLFYARAALKMIYDLKDYR